MIKNGFFFSEIVLSIPYTFLCIKMSFHISEAVELKKKFVVEIHILLTWSPLGLVCRCCLLTLRSLNLTRLPVSLTSGLAHKGREGAGRCFVTM